MSRRLLSWLAVAVALAAGLPAGTGGAERSPARALEEHYSRLQTLEARFIQRYTLGRVTQVESGRVYFSKPGRMRWEYDSPEPKTFLADGRYVYLYVPRERQVSRTRLREAADWRVPFGLLTGRVEMAELFARVEIKPTVRPGQPLLIQLRGLPRHERQGFSEVWFDLNPQGQLERVEIRQPDGALMEFHFRDWRENEPLPARLFRLEVPPGTAWLDADPVDDLSPQL